METKKEHLPHTMNFKDRQAIEKALKQTKYENYEMQKKANLGLKELLSNNVDHLKTTSYSRFFDEAVDHDINLAKPNEYYVSPRVNKKLDRLGNAVESLGRATDRSKIASMFQTTGQLSEEPGMKSKVQLIAEKKLQDRLRKMSAAYHHHYHNAIVGHEDPDSRYNAKWLDQNPELKLLTSNEDTQNLVQNEIGSVRVGAFRRGQGGLFSKLSRPFDAQNAKQLYVEAEKKKKLLEIGVDFGSQEELQNQLREDDMRERQYRHQRYKRDDGRTRKVGGKFKTPLNRGNQHFTFTEGAQKEAQKASAR